MYCKCLHWRICYVNMLCKQTLHISLRYPYKIFLVEWILPHITCFQLYRIKSSVLPIDFSLVSISLLFVWMTRRENRSIPTFLGLLQPLFASWYLLPHLARFVEYGTILYQSIILIDSTNTLTTRQRNFLTHGFWRMCHSLLLMEPSRRGLRKAFSMQPNCTRERREVYRRTSLAHHHHQGKWMDSGPHRKVMYRWSVAKQTGKHFSSIVPSCGFLSLLLLPRTIYDESCFPAHILSCNKVFGRLDLRIENVPNRQQKGAIIPREENS